MLKKKENIKSFKDLRFNITEDMQEMIIELLVSNQMLENKDFPQKYKKLLNQYVDRITLLLAEEFEKHNQVELKQFKDLISK